MALSDVMTSLASFFRKRTRYSSLPSDDHVSPEQHGATQAVRRHRAALTTTMAVIFASMIGYLIYYTA